uniref:Alkylated DNA repair protein AlkB homologue 8 N-terminal domain-containing protein n=1 Tax=Nothobranchius kadleci TaxID=1051664 RepID=A0A1A8C8J6_NOTKA
MDELLLLNRTNRDFAHSAALCFTETWLSDLIPDNGVYLPGFCLHRADREKEPSGKTKGGGICFYINECWCTDATVLSKHCSSNLETIFLNCKPFYSPREISSFILIGVYIHPQADVSVALQTLADQVTSTENKYPDSVLIILGDFNQAKLNSELPKYRQHIRCPTRGKNILDHCYTVLKGAYHSVPRAALGLSDHNLIHLIPTYKLKSVKPAIRTVRKWTNEAKEELQDCFDCTDWRVFADATGDLNELTDTVTSYITFCEEVCVPTKTFRTFNNNKPWFTATLSQLRRAKEQAYRAGDRPLYKSLRNTLNKEIRAAKIKYAAKLKNQFTANNPTLLWRNIQQITNYRRPSSISDANHGLAEELNGFYCRFEERNVTPLLHSSIAAAATPHLETLTPLSSKSQAAFLVKEEDVCNIFRRQNVWKAPGPDEVIPSCLRTCAVQLAPVFTTIFNRSLELCEVPSCFKSSTIIPVPKKSSPTELNDYRPVALTSVVMKSFERLVLSHLKSTTAVKILKFADDTTVIGLIQDGDESAYQREVERLVVWCSQHNLELNTLKTVEMVVDFRKLPTVLPPLTISNSPVSMVDSFKFLGTIISRDLKWETNINSILKKAQQRMYFLRQLRKYGLPQELLIIFYTAAVESILCSSITVWFGSATKMDKCRLQRIIKTAGKIIGAQLPSVQELYISRTRKKAVNIVQDATHPASTLFHLLPSGRRDRSLYTKTTRHKNSFFPSAISLLNL